MKIQVQTQEPWRNQYPVLGPLDTKLCLEALCLGIRNRRNKYQEVEAGGPSSRFRGQCQWRALILARYPLGDKNQGRGPEQRPRCFECRVDIG
jgi:hypothetical protein